MFRHAFRPVHEHLDELVASWRDLADVIAERDAISQDVLIDVVRTLEHQPPRRPTIARPARESPAG